MNFFDLIRGYKTALFNVSLIAAGAVLKLNLGIPTDVIIVAKEIMHAFGVESADGSTLIGIGVAGLLLRARTTTPIGRRR